MLFSSHKAVTNHRLRHCMASAVRIRYIGDEGLRVFACNGVVNGSVLRFAFNNFQQCGAGFFAVDHPER